MKFGINFTSCSENGNEIARGAAECYFAVIAITSGIYPKISLLPVLSQINTIASFVKVKISETRFHNEYWLLAAPGESRRQRADYFFVHREEADSQPTE